MSSGTPIAQGSQPWMSSDEEETSPSMEDVHQRLSQLPDLVLSTVPSRQRQSNTSASSPLSMCPPRVPPRKYKKKSKVDVVDYFTKDVSSEKTLLCSAKTTMSLPDQSWIQVGKELRTIADDFRSTYKKVSLQKTLLLPIKF